MQRVRRVKSGKKGITKIDMGEKSERGEECEVWYRLLCNDACIQLINCFGELANQFRMKF